MQKNLKFQNLFLVLASYLFYGWWDWRFLSLIFFSTGVDFWVGLQMQGQTRLRRKVLLWISIIVNLGFLGFFKYYNFFLDNLIKSFSFFGATLQADSLQIILPVGISFYTFQTLSYSIDVYRGKLEPTRDFISFAAFVSFFPQLVAGPIERATNLLPQFFEERKFDSIKAVDGCRQILWGLFKKIVVADNCAELANRIFNNYDTFHGSTLLLGAIFFAFQIYGDFSGYSDIAIGTSRLFGFNLMRNFAFPYFSRDIAEFWRRWHISLSTWFRDYIYIPMGGSGGNSWKSLRNIFVIFVVSGFWHGANWTFVFWGLLNAIYFIPLYLSNRNRSNLDTVAEHKMLPSLREALQMSATFFLTLIAWVFFRSGSLADAVHYLQIMFSRSIFLAPQIQNKQLIVVPFLLVLIGSEWLQRDKQHALQFEGTNLRLGLRWGVYYALIFAIVFFGGSQQDFIYFQF